MPLGLKISISTTREIGMKVSNSIKLTQFEGSVTATKEFHCPGTSENQPVPLQQNVEMTYNRFGHTR